MNNWVSVPLICNQIRTFALLYFQEADVKPRRSSIPGYHKEHTAHSKTGQQHVHPDIRGEGVEEGEDTWIGAVWFVVQYADAQGHEGFGEVNNFLSDISDGQWSHSQVSYLVLGTKRGLQDDRDSF